MASSPHTDVDLRSEGPSDGVLKLIIAGRLDSSTTGGIWRRASTTVNGAHVANVLIDATGIEYCDGAGIALLVHLRRLQNKANGDLRIDGLRPEFADLLDDGVARVVDVTGETARARELPRKSAKPQSKCGVTFRSS